MKCNGEFEAQYGRFLDLYRKTVIAMAYFLKYI